MKKYITLCVLVVSTVGTAWPRVPRPVYEGVSEPITALAPLHAQYSFSSRMEDYTSMPTPPPGFSESSKSDDKDEAAREPEKTSEVINKDAPRVDDLESVEWGGLRNYFYRIVKDLRRLEHGFRRPNEHQRVRMIVDHWDELPNEVRGAMRQLMSAWESFQEIREQGFPHDPSVGEVTRPDFGRVRRMSPSGTHMLHDLFRFAGVVGFSGRFDKEKRTPAFFDQLWGDAKWKQCRPLSKILDKVTHLDLVVVDYLERHVDEGQNRRALSDFGRGHDSGGIWGKILS